MNVMNEKTRSREVIKMQNITKFKSYETRDFDRKGVQRDWKPM